MSNFRKYLKHALAVNLSLFSLCSSFPSIAAEKSKPDNAQGADKDGKSKKEFKARGDAPCVSWTMFGVPTRAVLLCVHGLGLHSDSFEHFGKSMSGLGIPTYAIDVRGFGSWMDAKGHQNVNFKACIEDVKGTLEWLHKAHPGRPIFLLGESMGGAIVIHAAAQYPQLIDGLISACASGDRFKQKKTNLKVAMHALLGPRRKFDIGETIVDQAAGDNTKLEEQWKDDPLNNMDLSPLELLQFQKFMDDNHEQAKKINSLPVLIVQGSKDGLVKPEGTQELYDEMPTKDKQMIFIKNGEHLIFEEGQCTEQDILGVARWIFAHCPKVPEVTETIANLSTRAQALIEAGNNDEAIKLLQKALQDAPEDANLHYLLGLALYHMHQFKPAMQNFLLARQFDPGSQAAQNSNKMMMVLPTPLTSPRRRRRAIPSLQQLNKPRVIVFNATWCQPCKDMDAVIEQAKARFGQQVDFQTVNVDDPKNSKLVDEYDIGPVPTTVYVKANGDIGSFQVGYSGIDGIAKGMVSLLPTPGAPAAPVPATAPMAQVVGPRARQFIRAQRRLRGQGQVPYQPDGGTPQMQSPANIPGGQIQEPNQWPPHTSPDGLPHSQ